MATTASTPLSTPSPELPESESQSEAPRRGFSRGLLAATVAVVAAITGGVFWLTSGSSGNDQPSPERVQIVQDGRWGGPDVYEHGRLQDGSTGTTDQRFGSADTLEHQNGSDSTGSAEHHATPRAE